MNTNNLTLEKITALFLSLLISILSLTIYMDNRVVATNSSQSYTVFSASGTYKRSYTLQANPVQDNSRDIIGNDDRYSDNRLSGVVKIYTSSNIGTGFFVDEHTIATAAHCVFNGDTGNFNNSNSKISSIRIYDENGNSKQLIRSAYEIHIPNKYISNYMNNSNYNSYDYALITISENIDNIDAYLNFNLGVTTDKIAGSSLPVYTTGFPSDKTGKYTCQGTITMMEEGCLKSEIIGDDRNIITNLDVIGGQSGSPIYTYTEYNNQKYYTVIGIVAYSHAECIDQNGNISTQGLVKQMSNYGPRITTELLHFYKNNSNIEW